MLEETASSCPYCGESITLLLDLSVNDQDYIEDCEVCCQPMRVQCRAVASALLTLTVDRADS